MTRFWAEGEPIVVQVDADGLPVQFVWRGQTYGVQMIANRWRLEDEWWRAGVYREYYKVATTTGALVILYREVVKDAWWLQRVYD